MDSTHVCVRVHVHMCACACVRVHVFVCVRACACIRACVRVRMCMCARVCACMRMALAGGHRKGDTPLPSPEAHVFSSLQQHS